LPPARKEFASNIALKEKALSAISALEGNGEEGGRLSVSAIIAAFDEARVAAFGEGARRQKPASKDEEVADALIELGASLDQCQRVFVSTQERRKRNRQPPIDSVSYFINRIKELVAAERVPFPEIRQTATGMTLSEPAGQKPPEPMFGRQSPATRATWRTRLAGWRSKGLWLGSWGPKPDEPGCETPADLIAEIQPQPELL